ncbi:MAG: hypothetical protein ACHRHE_24355 [Tepidisphaerales bacterium]
MAEMTIRLRRDPQTGKQDIIISLRSDEDALPHEHEQMHQQLVNKLLEGGVVKAEEVGKVVVERENKEGEPAAPVSNPAQPERRAAAEGH